jgi:hypothetical protein
VGTIRLACSRKKSHWSGVRLQSKLGRACDSRSSAPRRLVGAREGGRRDQPPRQPQPPVLAVLVPPPGLVDAARVLGGQRDEPAEQGRERLDHAPDLAGVVRDVSGRDRLAAWARAAALRERAQEQQAQRHRRVVRVGPEEPRARRGPQHVFDLPREPRPAEREADHVGEDLLAPADPVALLQRGRRQRRLAALAQPRLLDDVVAQLVVQPHQAERRVDLARRRHDDRDRQALDRHGAVPAESGGRQRRVAHVDDRRVHRLEQDHRVRRRERVGRAEGHLRGLIRVGEARLGEREPAAVQVLVGVLVEDPLDQHPARLDEHDGVPPLVGRDPVGDELLRGREDRQEQLPLRLGQARRRLGAHQGAAGVDPLDPPGDLVDPRLRHRRSSRG